MKFRIINKENFKRYLDLTTHFYGFQMEYKLPMKTEIIAWWSNFKSKFRKDKDGSC